jgi:hypothetical protein
MSTNSVSSKNQINEILFSMGGFGVLFFTPFYLLLQKGFISYKALLLFESIFFANPHLVASYLRAYTDKAETNRYKFYTLLLPLIIFAAIASFIHFLGLNFIWTIGSLYFYWQWWHHSRQSFGIGRKYQANLKGSLEQIDFKLNDLAIWSVAICGIALKSTAARDYYEGIPIRTLHLPAIFVQVIIGITLLLCTAFLLRQVWLLLSKQIIQSNFLIHWMIQSFVFICFFGLLPTDIGIIAASFWHCTQYMSHVRNHQEVKVSNGLLAQPFWKAIYPKENWFSYLVFLITISLSLLLVKLGLSSLNVLALVFGFSMTITLHHYLLDAVLWTSKEVNWSLNRAQNT